jgi:pyruvate/2-oxoglutarate dehydrogenase complex dihydrolipoamide dehydrogenase (E3) component
MNEAVQTDVVVLGMGPGGEDVAGRLAQAGLDVVGVEPDLVGGECPYWGCVPSKTMLRAAHLLAEARRVRGMAGDAVVRPDWARWPSGSARRRPTAGTTRWPWTASRARAAGSFEARAEWSVRGR